MSFGSPALVREVARRSPRIQALPVATQRQIVTACGSLALVATPSTPGTGTDVTAGVYLITNTPNGQGAPLRSAASTSAAALDTIPEGAAVIATGENDNFFARVQAPGAGASMGWISTMFLTPQSTVTTAAGGLVLTAPEVLQLRTLLAAWSHQQGGNYGVNAGDFDQSAAADGAQAIVVAQFQRWRGGLRTDGVVDSPTQVAVLSWAQDAVVGVVTPGGPVQTPGGQRLPVPPAGTPGAPTGTPGAPSPPPASSFPVVPVVIAAVVLGALLLQEQKKKKRGK